MINALGFLALAGVCVIAISSVVTLVSSMLVNFEI